MYIFGQHSDDTYDYAYNGLGDRLSQIVNGEATNYTLDTVMGLTQVLDDGTNTYLYGLDRVGEQQPAGWAYHLPDALGSVRQLTDADAGVTLARSYEPFGSVMASSGLGETNYSFTGEWADGTGLVHLRARYYAPFQGGFISRDSWEQDYKQPLSINRWLYAFAQPISNVDPSGQYPVDYEDSNYDFCTTNYDPLLCGLYFYYHTRNSVLEEPPDIWHPAVEVFPPMVTRNVWTENWELVPELVPYGTSFGQKYVCGCNNACGIVALASIFSTTDDSIVANDLYWEANEYIDDLEDGTFPHDLWQIVEKQPGWTATAYLNYETPGDWARYWTFNKDQAHWRLYNALSNNFYPVIGVQCAPYKNGEIGKGSGHWVVVSGLNDHWDRKYDFTQFIRIMNPYNLQIEYYDWQTILDNWYLDNTENHPLLIVRRDPEDI